jgi:hypothetical protein
LNRDILAPNGHSKLLCDFTHQVFPTSGREEGFKIIVSKKSEEGATIEGTLHRSRNLIGRFFRRVVWQSENINQPPSWTIGVSMDVHGGDESRLADELQAAINLVS